MLNLNLKDVNTFDLETGTQTAYGRKASPFNPDNLIVAIGSQRQGAEVLGSYSKQGIHDPDWFINILSGTKLLVGQNIKFDILYAIRDPRNHEAWMDWVAAGGKIWDCQIAEYLLRGMKQSAQMLSLDDMVEAYGGNLKIDEVKAMWEAGYDTTEIPKQLLMNYLLGYKDGDVWVNGDIGNTYLVFKGQYAKAQKRGMLKCIMLNMCSLICSIEMEFNGMAVDLATGLEHAKELEADIEAARKAMFEYLPKDLPFQFNWGSNKQLSALIFGGVVTYDEQVPMFDDNGEPVFFQADGTAYYVEPEFHSRLGEMVTVGVDGVTEERIEELKAAGCLVKWKSGKNAGLFKTKKVKVPDTARGQKLQWQEFTYRFHGFTKPRPEWATKNAGVYQVNADVMEELEGTGIPFLDDLAELNKKQKDLTTYYITYDAKKQVYSGMLTLVDENGIIHHNINHTATVTARFSSSKPNLQNVPRKDKSRVKMLFVSRWRKDGLIVQSDFTSLEVYIQALLTQDPQMLADLKSGLDMHCLRVAAKYGIDYGEAVRLCKVDNVKPWPQRRTECKEFSFQRAYGAQAKAIAKATKMDIADVEVLIAEESKRYARVDQFYDEVTDEINASRVPTDVWIMHSQIKGLRIQLGEGFYRTPDGKKYTYSEHESPAGVIKRGGCEASFSPPEIKNYIVQGTGAEWAKAAMWLVVRAFYRRRNFGGLAVLVNQVHDAIYLDAHKSVAREAAALLHAAMEEASNYMEYKFDWPVEVPVPSETTFGRSMYRESKFKSKRFKALVAEYRAEIRREEMADYVPIRERT